MLQVNEAIRLYKVWMKVKVQCDLENAFPSSLAEILCTVAYQRLGNTQAGMQRQKHALDVLAKALEITVAVVDAMRDEESFQPVISSRYYSYDYVTSFSSLWEKEPYIIHPADPTWNMVDHCRLDDDDWDVIGSAASNLLEALATWSPRDLWDSSLGDAMYDFVYTIEWVWE